MDSNANTVSQQPLSGGAAPDDDASRVGLGPTDRYRCGGCGNVTRFDIEVTEHSRRFWHADLSGQGRVEDEERDTQVRGVTCRWCGSQDVIVEPRPATDSGSAT